VLFFSISFCYSFVWESSFRSTASFLRRSSSLQHYLFFSFLFVVLLRFLIGSCIGCHTRVPTKSDIIKKTCLCRILFLFFLLSVYAEFLDETNCDIKSKVCLLTSYNFKYEDVTRLLEKGPKFSGTRNFLRFTCSKDKYQLNRLN
jgi:hypothetical protein